MERKAAMVVNDKYIIYPQYAGTVPVCIVQCTRTTKTLAVCQKIHGVRGTEEYRLPITAPPAADDELREAQQSIDDEINRNRRHRQEQRQREADPHYQLVDRLKNGDTEPWGKLTLDQLKTIAGWLDTVA
jgi:hypothetical protein